MLAGETPMFYDPLLTKSLHNLVALRVGSSPGPDKPFTVRFKEPLQRRNFLLARQTGLVLTQALKVSFCRYYSLRLEMKSTCADVQRGCLLVGCLPLIEHRGMGKQIGGIPVPFSDKR